MHLIAGVTLNKPCELKTKHSQMSKRPLHCCVQEQALRLPPGRFPRDRNAWGVLSAQHPFSDLALAGRAPHFPKSTSLLLNALPPVLPTSLFLKPGIATSVCIQGFSLHWWAYFAGQEPPFITRKKKRKKKKWKNTTNHWKTVNEWFLPSSGNSINITI